MKVSGTAKARIEKAGGEVITFDQLARRAPTGKNTVLAQGIYLKLFLLDFFPPTILRSKSLFKRSLILFI